MQLNDEYTRYGSQIGYVVIANFALLLLGFIRLPILTKGLGTTLYGIWSLINITISLIVPFALLGFSASIVRFLAAKKNKNRIREDFLSAYFIVFISGSVLSVFLILFSDYLATTIFKGTNSSLYINLASILILLNSIKALIFSFFRTFKKIRLYTIIKLIQSGFEVGLIILFILFGLRLTGVISALIINGIIFNFIVSFVIFKQIGFRFPKFSRSKSYLRYGVPLIPNSAILWIIHSSDRYMISYFMGAAFAGIYSGAYSLGNYASFFLMPIGIVLFPTITKFYDEKNLAEVKNYLKYSLKYVMMIAIPSALGLSILAKPMLKILTTTEFIPGSTIVPFVACGAVLLSFYQICVYVIHLVKRTELIVKLLSTSAALNIVLNIVLIPRMGILGAGIATLIAYGVLGMLTVMITRRYFKFNLSVPFIFKSIFSSIIMVVCIRLINLASIISVLISILLGILVYFSVLLVIKGLNKREINFFINFLRSNVIKIRAIKEKINP